MNTQRLNNGIYLWICTSFVVEYPFKTSAKALVKLLLRAREFNARKFITWCVLATKARPWWRYSRSDLIHPPLYGGIYVQTGYRGHGPYNPERGYNPLFLDSLPRIHRFLTNFISITYEFPMKFIRSTSHSVHINFIRKSYEVHMNFTWILYV